MAEKKPLQIIKKGHNTGKRGWNGKPYLNDILRLDLCSHTCIRFQANPWTMLEGVGITIFFY